MEDLVANLLTPTSSRDYISEYLNLFFSSVQSDKDPEGYSMLKDASLSYTVGLSTEVVLQISERNIRLTNFHDTVDFTDELSNMVKGFLVDHYSGFHSLSFRFEPGTLDIRQLEQEFVPFELTQVDQLTYLVDLSKGFDGYLQRLKPNVKREIKKSFEHFQYEVVTNYNEFVLNYGQLHGELSGGQISEYSWSILLNSLENDRAIAVEVKYKGRFAGGAIFSTGKKTAHYTNGAFDRRLFPLPITHGLFITAFQALCLSGRKLVVLDDFFSDQFEDDKKANIRNFKKKFCNRKFERQVYQFKIVLRD